MELIEQQIIKALCYQIAIDKFTYHKLLQNYFNQEVLETKVSKPFRKPNGFLKDNKNLKVI